MSFFNTISRKVGNFFKNDVGGTAKDFFKNPKSTLTRGYKELLPKISSGLGSVGNVLGEVGKVANSALKSPLVQGGLMALGPEFSLGANALARGINDASSVFNQGSSLTNTGNYRGNPSQVASNILERSSKIVNTIKPRTVQEAVASPNPSSIESGGIQYAMM
jgi:hypothetical protein